MRAPAWAMLLLASCAGPRPSIPEAATVSVPAGWRSSTAEGGAIDARWWLGFGDPALDALVYHALARNNDLLEAAARVAEARAGFQLAAGQAQPSLSLGGQGGRERTLTAFGAGLDQRYATGAFTADYEIDLFHRLSAGTEAARARLLASEAAQDAARLAVVAAVVEGYIGLCVLDAKRAIAQAALDARRQESGLVRRRVDAGYASQLQLAQAEAELETAARLVPATDRAVARQEHALDLLAGTLPEAVRRGQGLDALTLPETPLALPSELLRQRPDIAEAEAALAAADHDLDAARAAFLPRVRLEPSGGAVASSAIASPVSLFALGGSVLAPLFQGGRLRAAQSGAAARRDAMAFAYRRAVLTAFGDVENALAASAALEREDAAARRQRDALARAFALADARTKAGYDASLERLVAQRSLLDAQLAVAEVRGARLQATVALVRSLGGGWHR